MLPKKNQLLVSIVTYSSQIIMVVHVVHVLLVPLALVQLVSNVYLYYNAITIMLFVLLNNNLTILHLFITKQLLAKKIKSDALSISKSDDDNMAWVVLDFPLGPNGDRRTVSVPEQHASWQAMIDASKNPYGTLHLLSTTTKRLVNGGSPPMILYALMLDDSLPNAALLQETSLRNSKQDRGIIVVGLPALVRSLASFQTAKWRKATDGEVCAEWNRMTNLFDVNITAGSNSGRVDYTKQVFYYRSSSFIRDNSAAISKMVGSHDNRTAFGRPECNNPICTKESVKRGYCEQHLPKVSMIAVFVYYTCVCCINEMHLIHHLLFVRNAHSVK